MFSVFVCFVGFALWTQWFCVQMMHCTVYAATQCIVICICSKFEENITFYFSNSEGFNECMPGKCGGVHYLQKGGNESGALCAINWSCYNAQCVYVVLLLPFKFSL